MTSLQIWELPRDVYEALAHRAEKEGRSLAQQAIVELRRVSEFEVRSRRMGSVEKLCRRLSTESSDSPLISPEVLIREDRDR